jgi:cytochrome c553
MGEAVEHSFSALTKTDVAAIASYVKAVPPVTDGKARPRQTQGAPSNVVASLRGVTFNNETEEPAHIFLGACGSCHHWTGSGSKDGYYPSLFHNGTVGSANANNLAQIILHGVHRKTASHDISMPAFGPTLSDREVAGLANFLTKQFGSNAAPMTDVEVRKLR